MGYSVGSKTKYDRDFSESDRACTKVRSIIFLYGADMHLGNRVSALKAANLVKKALAFPGLSRGSQDGVWCFCMLCFYVDITKIVIFIGNLKKAWAHSNKIQRPKFNQFSTTSTRKKFARLPKSHGVYYNNR